LARLSVLDLSDNKLTTSALEAINLSAFGTLEELYLSHNKLDQIPESVCW
jgi:Leucine-rich repeat (LRR) protein